MPVADASQTWEPCGGNAEASDQSHPTMLLAEHLTRLSAIASDVSTAFHASNEPVAPERLVGFHHQYLTWQAELPVTLHSKSGGLLPHVAMRSSLT